MRDDLTRKNNIPNKSKEFIQQGTVYWPPIYMPLGAKSMSISAINTCFWRVKSRKQGCTTAPNTRKQLRVSEIQKLRMLGVFTPGHTFVCAQAKNNKPGCQKEIIAIRKNFKEAKDSV